MTKRSSAERGAAKLPRREPDFEQLRKVLKREARPAHLPFYEHLATCEFIARCTAVPLNRFPDTVDDRTYPDGKCRNTGDVCLVFNRLNQLPDGLAKLLGEIS